MKGKAQNKEAYTVYSVEKALNILSLFSEPGKTLSATEISETLGMSYSTAFRLISTLASYNYLYKNPHTLRYSLGSMIPYLNQNYAEPYEFTHAVTPYMPEITEKLGETSCIWAVKSVQENSRICLARYESTHRLRPNIQINETLPLTSGSSGRLLVAYLPKEDRDYLQSFSSAVEDNLLDMIREQGFCSIPNNRLVGTTGIFVPLFDPAGGVLCVIGISGATSRFDERDLPDRVAYLKSVSARITRDLAAK